MERNEGAGDGGRRGGGLVVVGRVEQTRFPSLRCSPLEKVGKRSAVNRFNVALPTPFNFVERQVAHVAGREDSPCRAPGYV